MLLWNRLESDEHGAVHQVRSAHDVLYTVQNHRPSGIEHDLAVVGIELPSGEATPSGQPTQSVGKPRRQMRDVVEGQHVRVVRGNK